MKFIGLKPKGLNIVPTPLKTLTISPIKYDGSAIMSFCSDLSMLVTIYYVEALMFKYNLKATLFDNPFIGDMSTQQRQDVCNTGKIKSQIYFPTDRWRDKTVLDTEPDITIKYPLIIDYLNTTYDQAAVDTGYNVTVGQTKAQYYPNHGTQLYAISNGKYGNNGTINGTVDILTDLLNYIKQWCKDTFGYYPSVASYRNGMTGCSYAMPTYFLADRESNASYDVTYSAFTKATSILLDITTRWWDFVNNLGISSNYADSRTLCGQKLDSAVASNGWYRDFTHWHGVSTADMPELENYFSYMANYVIGKNVVNLEMGETIEYKFLKDIVRRVNLYDNNGSLSILVDYKDNIIIPKDGINSTITVRLNLTGTSLQGLEITSSNADIIKVSTDNFLVQLKFSGEGFNGATIAPTTTPSYMAFTVPSGTKSINGTTLTATSNVPCKFVVYQKVSGSAFSTILPIARYNGFQTSITLTIDPTKDTYVGIVDKYGNSALI